MVIQFSVRYPKAGYFCGWKVLWKFGRGPNFVVLKFADRFFFFQGTKNCLRSSWGWLGLACEIMQIYTSTKTFERPILENSYYATREWQLCWSVCCNGSQEATLGYSTLTRGTGSVFCWSCFCFLHCSVHLLSRYTWDSLRKEPCVSRTLSLRRK